MIQGVLDLEQKINYSSTLHVLASLVCSTHFTVDWLQDATVDFEVVHSPVTSNDTCVISILPKTNFAAIK